LLEHVLQVEFLLLAALLLEILRLDQLAPEVAAHLQAQQATGVNCLQATIGNGLTNKCQVPTSTAAV
jgi:hypothetical protein